jgi:hypothetical protein
VKALVSLDFHEHDRVGSRSASQKANQADDVGASMGKPPSLPWL